jgi:osmotically-inducible protein OsmY
MMSDIATERDVQRAFLKETSLNSSSILVTCFDGVVTLTGSVETAADRAVADRVAKSVAGVNRVVNNLTVNT